MIELRDLTNVDESCDEVTQYLGTRVKALASGGLRFRSYRDPSNPNIYQDQIDIRGYWMDKLLAARWLLRRQVEYTFDQDYLSNFLDAGGDYEKKLQKTLYDMLLDLYESDVEFTSADTKSFTARTVLSQDSSHVIPKHLSSGLMRYLGIPNQTTTFSRELLRVIKQELAVAHRDQIEAMQWLNKFRVYKELPRGRESERYNKITLGGLNYYVFPENELGLLVLNAIRSIEFFHDYISNYGEDRTNEVYFSIGPQIDTLLAEGKTMEADALLKTLNKDDIQLLRLDEQILMTNVNSKLSYYQSLLTMLAETAESL